MNNPVKPVKVFLGIPHGGRLVPGVLKAYAEATRGGVRWMLADVGGSLLAKNFNHLWCRALNLRRERGCDYFVMLHSDIQPEPWWLDTLLAEYRRVDVDVLSVVVPIKDHRGLTTTGRAPPGNAGVTRFTLAEVAKFPVTFTAADVCPGEHLMVNTGLWVVDLRRPWVERFWPAAPPAAEEQRPAFTILDWIRQTPDGVYSEQCLSEDWLWSSWLQTNGVKVAATTAVRVLHTGERHYGSQDLTWGSWETDLGDKALPVPKI